MSTPTLLTRAELAGLASLDGYTRAKVEELIDALDAARAEREALMDVMSRKVEDVLASGFQSGAEKLHAEVERLATELAAAREGAALQHEADLRTLKAAADQNEELRADLNAANATAELYRTAAEKAAKERDEAHRDADALRGIYDLVRDHCGIDGTQQDRIDALIAIDDVMDRAEPGVRVLEIVTERDEAREQAARLAVEAQAMREALTAAKDAIDRDRTGLAAALNAIRKHVEGFGWLVTSRGPYEWDDDRYREEAGHAMRPVVEIAEKALAASGALADKAFRPAHAVLSAPSESERVLRERYANQARITTEDVVSAISAWVSGELDTAAPPELADALRDYEARVRADERARVAAALSVEGHRLRESSNDSEQWAIADGHLRAAMIVESHPIAPYPATPPSAAAAPYAEHVCDHRCGENGHHAWPSPNPKGTM